MTRLDPDNGWWESYRVHHLTIMERISLHTVYRDSGCWEFHGRVTNYNRGRLVYQDREQLVTHIAWRIMKGKKVRNGFQLNHTCDNERCWNIDHLYEGTQAQNLEDLRERGVSSYKDPKIKIEPFKRPTMQRKFL